MRSLTKQEAGAWCADHAICLNDRGHPVQPVGARVFKIEPDTGARIHQVATDLHPYLGKAETLVWFTEWGVWPSSERPHIFTRFRASYGESQPLIEVSAHVFGEDEIEDALSFVTLGVLFLWDIYVVIPQLATVHFSHDEWGWVEP